MADDDYEPTYEQMVNDDPLTCIQCNGTGIDDPYDGDDWMMRNL